MAINFPDAVTMGWLGLSTPYTQRVFLGNSVFPSVYEFLRGDIGNGESILFWSDPWKKMERLTNLVNDSGTQDLGVVCGARVAYIARAGKWLFCRTRSDQARLIIDEV